MVKKLIAGNWKMNGGLAANKALVEAIVSGLSASTAGPDVALAVPSPYLSQIAALLGGEAVALAAQDVSAHASGAYTGEVSATMLLDFGVQFALVGHSERRQYHGESDEAVALKVQQLLAVNITPVVCVGESLAQREAGETASVVLRQLNSVLAQGGPSLQRIVVAYEPVWAIGTGRTATPAQAQEVHALLRQSLRSAGIHGTRLLYGGSMNAANAVQLLAQQDIDGGLIGGASLKAADFLAIVAAAG